jgi:hypothetical protein
VIVACRSSIAAYSGAGVIEGTAGSVIVKANVMVENAYILRKEVTKAFMLYIVCPAIRTRVWLPKREKGKPRQPRGSFHPSLYQFVLVSFNPLLAFAFPY